MNKLELRKVLRKKKKSELIDLVGIFSKECPHFPLGRKVNKLNQEDLVSKLWGILLNLRSNYPDEDYSICLDILSRKDDKKAKMEIEDSSSYSNTQKVQTVISKFKIIPFVPNEVCTHLFELISDNNDMLRIWKNKHKLQGFVAFLAGNDISLPPALEILLYNRLFKNIQDYEVEESLIIDYSRRQLDLLEETLYAFFKTLKNNEIEIIFSIHLIYNFIIRLLEENNEKINFTYDDIPLFKRVILAQYLKISNKNECTDEELDNLAINLIDIMYDKSDKFNIKIMPWGDLD